MIDEKHKERSGYVWINRLALIESDRYHSMGDSACVAMMEMALLTDNDGRLRGTVHEIARLLGRDENDIRAVIAAGWFTRHSDGCLHPGPWWASSSSTKIDRRNKHKKVKAALANEREQGGQP